MYLAYIVVWEFLKQIIEGTWKTAASLAKQEKRVCYRNNVLLRYTFAAYIQAYKKKFF